MIASCMSVVRNRCLRSNFVPKGLIAKQAKFLTLASSNSAEDILTSIRQGNYNLVVVDSIQTLSLNDISSAQDRSAR